jgi:hypothetical protein
MATEFSYGIVLWAVPRFHRPSSFSRPLIAAAAPFPPGVIHKIEDNPPACATGLPVEPEQHETSAGLLTKH